MSTTCSRSLQWNTAVNHIFYYWSRFSSHYSQVRYNANNTAYFCFYTASLLQQNKSYWVTTKKSKCETERRNSATHAISSYFSAVLEADQVKALSVTEYLGHDVTLPCQFTQEPNTSITQVQWDLMSPEGNKNRIIVSNPRFGVNISESPLKDRVEIIEQSLIIKNFQISDAGSYICSIAAFPSGSFEGTTKLIVQGDYVIYLHQL